MALTLLLTFLQGSKYVDLIVAKGLNPKYLFLMTFLTMPNIWNEVLPITLFVSILFAWYSLLHNHELVVLQTLGLDPFTMFKPMLCSGVVTSFICLLLSSTIISSSSLKYIELRNQLVNSFNVKVVDNNKFTQLTPSTTIYIGKNDKSGTLNNILINTLTKTKEYTIYAQHARVLKDNHQFKILLSDGDLQSSDLQTKAVNFMKFNFYLFSIPKPETPTIKDELSQPRVLSLPELLHYHHWPVIQNLPNPKEFLTFTSHILNRAQDLVPKLTEGTNKDIQGNDIKVRNSLSAINWLKPVITLDLPNFQIQEAQRIVNILQQTPRYKSNNSVYTKELNDLGVQLQTARQMAHQAEAYLHNVSELIREANSRLSNLLLALVVPVILVYFFSTASFKRGTQIRPVVKSTSCVFLLKVTLMWGVFALNSYPSVFSLYGLVLLAAGFLMFRIARLHKKFI